MKSTMTEIWQQPLVEEEWGGIWYLVGDGGVIVEVCDSRKEAVDLLNQYDADGFDLEIYHESARLRW